MITKFRRVTNNVCCHSNNDVLSSVTFTKYDSNTMNFRRVAAFVVVLLVSDQSLCSILFEPFIRMNPSARDESTLKYIIN